MILTYIFVDYMLVTLFLQYIVAMIFLLITLSLLVVNDFGKTLLSA